MQDCIQKKVVCSICEKEYNIIVPGYGADDHYICPRCYMGEMSTGD
jgi:transposase-like protein